MENKQQAGEPDFDPRSDLDLLQRARSSVDMSHILDFGPWWYAPMLATCIAGLTLFSQTSSFLSAVVIGLLGFGSGAFGAIHDFRRRTVRPKKSIRSTGFMAIIVLTSLFVISLWGTAISSLGYERFFPGYALLGWMLTTAMFLLIRQFSYWWLARRQVLR